MIYTLIASLVGRTNFASLYKSVLLIKITSPGRTLYAKVFLIRISLLPNSPFSCTCGFNFTYTKIFSLDVIRKKKKINKNKIRQVPHFYGFFFELLKLVDLFEDVNIYQASYLNHHH